MRFLLSVPQAGIDRFDAAVKAASVMRPGLTRSAAIREAMILWELTVVPNIEASLAKAEEVQAIMADARKAG